MTEDELKKRIDDATTAVRVELDWANAKFPPFRSMHEGYAIIQEELDELWDDIKRKNVEFARSEAIQVAAMALRFIVDLPETGIK